MDGLAIGRTCLPSIRPCRDSGIGQRLKQHQRNELLSNGVGVMFWTYDPLVARNAHLNICRLGADISEYVPHMYGADDENSLDAIIGTDRFIVEWDLESSTALPSEPVADAPVVNARIDGDGRLLPSDGDLPDLPQISIGIPGDIHALKNMSPDLAARWRSNTRRAFVHYLANEYKVTGFSTNPAEYAGFYHLRRMDH